MDLATTGGSWCYSSSSTNCDAYGRLYDFATAQLVCPANWGLPTDAEWITMEIFLGMSDADANSYGNRGSGIATILKSNSGYWLTNPGTETGTNTSGFTALPAGYMVNGGVSWSLNEQAHFWTSSEWDASNGIERTLFYGATVVGRGSIQKFADLSVRCILRNP